MVSREGQFLLQLKVADAFRLSDEALIVIGARILVRDEAAGLLMASTPWDLKSWGETIKVAVQGTDGNAVVLFNSQSRVRTTLIDWGRSSDNLKHFGDWVTKPQPAPGPPLEMVQEMRTLIDAARSAVADLQAFVPPVPQGDDKET